MMLYCNSINFDGHEIQQYVKVISKTGLWMLFTEHYFWRLGNCTILDLLSDSSNFSLFFLLCCFFYPKMKFIIKPLTANCCVLDLMKQSQSSLQLVLNVTRLPPNCQISFINCIMNKTRILKFISANNRKP